MDAVELIKQDHRHIENLFAKFLETEPEATPDDLFQQIQTALTTHIEIEEHVLYPAVRQFAPERVDLASKEHAEVRKILAELLNSDLNEVLFESRFRELIDTVKRHVWEAEGPNGILELAHRHLSPKILSKLTTQIRALRRRIEGRLAA
jgi:hemerythrin superfamily protein